MGISVRDGRMRRVRALLLAMCTAMVVPIVAPSSFVSASGGPLVAEGSSGTPVAVYDAIVDPTVSDGPTVSNVPSVAFQATSTSEFGDLVELAAGPRKISSVDVMMSSWACQVGAWSTGNCQTQPGATFTHPITLNIYDVDNSGATPRPGQLIATRTQTFTFPYRPSTDAANCPAVPPAVVATQWMDASGTCVNGRATMISFDLTNSSTVLPDQVFWSVAFNTSTHGYQPIGSAACGSTCPYDALNVGVSSFPFVVDPDAVPPTTELSMPLVGTDVDADAALISSTWAPAYCGEGSIDTSGFLGTLHYTDCGWAAYRPIARINAVGPSAEVVVTRADIGDAADSPLTHEWNFGVDADVDHGIETLTANSGPVAGASSADPAVAPALANGNLKLTVRTETGAYEQAAMVMRPDPGTVRLGELLDNGLSYWSYVDQRLQAPNPPSSNPGVYAASLQIFYSCFYNPGGGAKIYNGSILIGPGADQPSFRDVDGNPIAWDTWQKFQFPAAQQNTLVLKTGSDDANRPASMPAGFGEFELSKLTSVCADAQVKQVALKLGRTMAYSRASAYADLVTVMGTTYDFQFDAPQAPATSADTVTAATLGGEDDTTPGTWSTDHIAGRDPGLESIARDDVTDLAADGNGALKLVTLANEQARATYHFDPSSAPTLRELLYARPTWQGYASSAASPGHSTAFVAAGELQFGLSCDAWNGNVILSPGDMGNGDINGDPLTWDTWQTFQFPDPEDVDSLIFVSTDDGSPRPVGVPAGFDYLRLTDLIDICGDGVVTEARFNQGRSTEPQITTYLDHPTFWGQTYDFLYEPPTFTPSTEPVYGNEIGGEDDTTSEWAYDHEEPKVPGHESVVTDPVPTAAAAAGTNMLNGALRLETKGFANGALSQQARVIHRFAPADAPTLQDLLWSRPEFTVYADSTQSVDSPAGAAGLQFGFQCDAWNGVAVLQPSDAPGTLDIDGNPSVADAWQTFRYPSSGDLAGTIFVATDGGTAPAGFEGYKLVKVADLVDRCGQATVLDARASAGRNTLEKVVSYIDDLTFMGTTYDFVTATAPALSGDAPDALVGAAYPAFSYTVGGVPAAMVAVSAGALPAGLSLSPEGSLSGTPTVRGTFVFTVTASNSQGSATVLDTITIGWAPVVANPAPDGMVGSVYAHRYTVLGDPVLSVDIDWNTGDLPPGLLLTPDGMLWGTATTPGTYEFTVVASNAHGSATLSEVVTISPDVTHIAYDSIGESLLPNVDSIAASSNQTPEFGDLVVLQPGTPRELASVDLALSSWGCETGRYTVQDSCQTTPGATFDHPITVRVYDVDRSGAVPAPGDLLATVTQTVAVPYRPSADVTCPPDPKKGFPMKWRAADGQCYTALAATVSIDMSGAGVVLPDEVIWTAEIPTTRTGYDPTGTPQAGCATDTSTYCPYDVLNFGAHSLPNQPSAGTDVDDAMIVFRSDWAGMQCSTDTTDPRVGVVSYSDGCGWSWNRPLARIHTAGSVPTVPTLSGDAPDADVNGAYPSFSYTIGGEPAPALSVTGDLPDGLSLDASTGVVSGTPSALGTWAFTVTASNSQGSVTVLDTITIGWPEGYLAPSISRAAPDGNVGSVFAHRYVAVGTPTPSVTVTSGALPTGLTLTPDGVLSGVASAAGVYTFTVTASNDVGSADLHETVVISSKVSDVAYDSIGDWMWPNPASIAAASQSTSEFGDLVGLASGTNRQLDSVDVTLSSWGCEQGQYNHPETKLCVTTPGATFDHPITLRLYEVDRSGAAAVPGALLAEREVTFAIPYRPSSDAACAGGRWMAVDGTCYSGLEHTVTFDLSDLGLVLPDEVIWTASIPTTKTGYGPAEVNGQACGSSAYTYCPWDVLNYGSESMPDAPFAGTDVDPEAIVFNSTSTAMHCLTAGDPRLGQLVYSDTCDDLWQHYRPLARIHTVELTPIAPSIAGDAPDAVVDEVYPTFSYTVGGEPAATVQVSAGALPDGLSLSTAGVLTGTPDARGTFVFTVTASNSQGSATLLDTITIGWPATYAAPTISGTAPGGTAGTTYSHGYTVEGEPTPTVSVSGTLPAGLTFDPATATLSGTPTTAGVYTFTVSATNVVGIATLPQTVVIAADPSLVAPTVSGTAPDAVLGEAYAAFQYTVTGTAPVTVSTLPSQLPPGMSLSSSGQLTGTPMARGVFAFPVTAANAYGTATVWNVVVVDWPAGHSAPSISGAAPDGNANAAYASYTYTMTGTPAPVLTRTGTLPPGLSLDTLTGVLSGTPTTPGVYTFTLTATNAVGSASLYETVVIGPDPTLASPTIAGDAPDAVVDAAYTPFSYTVGGKPAASVTVSAGVLPTGLSLSAAGVLTGTPSVHGTFVFTVTASNSQGSATLLDTITIGWPASYTAPTISGAAPDGEMGTAYPAFTYTVGGVPAASLSLSAGALPPGLNLDETTGVLSGTPTSVGVFVFVLTATNALGSTDLFETVEIGPPATSGVVAMRDYYPIAPQRLFDTRDQSPNAVYRDTLHTTRLAAGVQLPTSVLGIPGIAADASVAAVSLNVTAVNQAGAGYIRVASCDSTLASLNTSNVIFNTANRPVATAVFTPVSGAGELCLWSSVATDVVVDINGWFPTNHAFHPLVPARVSSTVAGQGNFLVTVPKAKVKGTVQGQGLPIKLTGVHGIPTTGVKAVSLTVTALNTTAAGYFQAMSCDADPTQQLTSNVNWVSANTRVSNAVIVPLSAAGQICFYGPSAADLYVDVNGWFSESPGYTSVIPKRVFDTRANSEGVSAYPDAHFPRLAAGQTHAVKIVGYPGLPQNPSGQKITALSLNVTAVNVQKAGYITVYACADGTDTDGVSSVNYTLPGENVANAVITPVAADGTVCFYSMSGADLVVDINGYFTDWEYAATEP